MKSKIFLLILSVFLVFSLSACNEYSNPIETIDFNVTFDELDLENNTAKFTVYGYPNEREFDQVETIIKNSLKDQNVTSPIDVSVYSSFEDSKEEENPFFGTVTYTEGNLSNNNLKQNTEENYLKFVE